MQSLIAPTEQFAYTEKTKIITAASAGDNVQLTVENNQGFSVDDYIVLKTPGNDQSHIAQVTVVTDDDKITVDTLKHNLKKNDDITLILFNQRKFYGSLTETGTYTQLSADGSPKDIEVDNPNGTLFEYTGSEGYLYFKATYYNEQTADETDKDESPAVPGDQSLRYCSLYSIRKNAALTRNEYVDDGRVESKRKIAESRIDSVVSLRYVLPLTEVPDIIKQIAQLLGAGYLDIEEFGKSGGGKEMIDQANMYLDQIKDGDLRLIGSDGSELARNDGGVLSGFPNTSVTDTDQDHKFTMDQKF